MKPKKAFTLIELLVVIAIIALLLAIIVPSLQTAKEMAGAAVCTSNEKQILTAWVVYAHDNDDELCSPGTVSYNPSSENYDWVEGVVGKDTVDSEIYGTNPNGTTGNQGIVGGALYPYYQNYELVHCPSDRRSNKPATDAPSKDGGYRTYSFTYHAGAKATQSMVNKGWALSTEEGFTKLTEMTSPGSNFVLVEENDSRGMNRGPWAMLLDHGGGIPGMIDSFGIYHNMRSILGFGDGHAEKIVWKDDRTEKYSLAWYNGDLPPYETTPADELNNEDFAWLKTHYAR